MSDLPRTHVVVIAHSMRHGSVGAVAWRHALLLSQDHEVTVISEDFPDGAPAALQTVAVRAFKWDVLRRFAHVPNELTFVRAVRAALERIHRRSPIGIVWCHSHSVTALAAAPLKARLGFRTVMTTHGDAQARPVGTYTPELTRFYRWITPRAFAVSDYVHVMTPEMAQAAVREGAAERRVRIVPNGIDPADLGLGSPPERPASSFMPEGRLRLAYVGSLWAVKGLQYLLAALSLHDAATPLGRASLRIAGSGPELASLKRLAKSLRLDDRVTFMGPIPRGDLPRLFEQSDLLCLPSISEVFPTVVLEAMLCALPVVGSDTGGIAELVVAGATGELASPGNSASLAEAIMRAARSPALLHEAGIAGQARAVSLYSWRVADVGIRAIAREACSTGGGRE